jgi:hypothetical protein
MKDKISTIDRSVNPLPVKDSDAHPSLGRPIALHLGRPLGLYEIFCLVFYGGLAVLFLVLLIVWRVGEIYTDYGPIPAMIRNRPWFLAVFAVLLGLVTLIGYRIYQARRFVAIHKNGLRLRLGAFKVRSWQWGEFSGISSAAIQEHFLHLPVRTVHQAYLYLKTGETLHLGSAFQDMPGLIDQLKTSLHPRLLTGLQSSYWMGHWSTFGPLAIQRQGGLRLSPGKWQVTKREEITIPWEQVESIDVQGGHLVVGPKGQTERRIPISQIPNLEILIDLIQQGDEQE